MITTTETQLLEDKVSLKDSLGIIASCICAIHCLVTPLAALMWPFIASHHIHEWFHIGLFLLIAPLALVAFVTQRKKHGSNAPMIYGIIGLALLSAEIIFHEISHLSPVIIATINLTGSVTLIYAHYCNIKLCQCHACHN